VVVPLPQVAVGRGYAVRIPQGVENETFNYSHFGSGGGDTALLRCWGFAPHLPTTIIP